MTRLLVAAAVLLAAPASAQPDAPGSDPALGSTYQQFHGDLRVVTNMVATAGLIHDATGAFPSTPFELLGSAAASRTGLRQTPLSSLTVGRDGDRLVLDYITLPVAPYERQDDVVRVVVTARADGEFVGDYEIRRRDDPDRGGRTLPYDRAGRYVVERGFGTACVDLGVVRGQLAAGTYTAEPGRLSAAPLTVRVHPPGQDQPVFYESRQLPAGTVTPATEGR